LEVVRALLQAHADPQLKDLDGDTARDLAERNGHEEIARLLAASF
jgi:ankyrin repeat protein